MLKDIEEDATYEDVVANLQQCFGTLETQEAYQVQLKARRRRKGESHSDLMKDVAAVVPVSLPRKEQLYVDLAAKDAYIDALNDRDLMIRVMEREPRTLEVAFKISERMELYARRVDLSEEPGSESESKIRSYKVHSIATTAVEPTLKF